MLLLAGWGAQAQLRHTGVYAQAIGQANLRAAADIESRLIGEIRSGTNYPVLGRNPRFPWLLLGERDSTLPMGWVFETLVSVTGNLNQVPYTELIIDATASIERAISATSRATAGNVAAATPTAKPTLGAFGVSGVVSGEVNIRYGPGVEYPRAGVAYAGDRFEVTGYHTQFPWVRIRYGEAASGQAWIARDLLEISGNLFNTAAISQAALQPAAIDADARRRPPKRHKRGGRAAARRRVADSGE